MKKTPVPFAVVAFCFGLSMLAAPFASYADNLFVDSGGGFDQTIKEFNSVGVGSTFASTDFGSPWGMAFDSAGSLYVAYLSKNTIEKFNSSGGLLSSNGTVFASGVVSPYDLAFDSAGNLYVTSYMGNSGVNSIIEKYSSSGGVLSSNGTVFATGLNAPMGLAFDSAGNLYVANLGNSTIEKFSSLGGVLSSNGTVFSSGLGGSAVAFDSAGNLYVSTDTGENQSKIEKFNFSGGVLSSNSTLFASPAEGALNMAFDSAGNLYVTAYNNIEEINSSGVVTNFATVTSGGSEVYGLAFQPVPEPSTWFLVTLGAVSLISGYRLRRKLLSPASES